MSLLNLLKTNDLCVSKNVYGTDKDYLHSYIRFYDHIFSNFIPKSILEIGVDHGASLCLWKLYFPDSKVVGIDNSKKPLHNLARQLVEQNLIEIKICDAYKLKLDHKFDLIIDDGPHTLKSQVQALRFIKNLNFNGVFIIEDLYHKKRNSIILKTLLLFWGKKSHYVVFKKASDDAILLFSRNSSVTSLIKNYKYIN